MKVKIKTLCTDITDLAWLGSFDAGVNRLLETGWTLVKRMPLSETRLYAELVKEEVDDPEEAQMDDLIGAMQTIQHECCKHESCRDCPMDDNCEHRPPNEWILPKDGADE